MDGAEDWGGQGSHGRWSLTQPWAWPDGSCADSGLPRTRGQYPVWPVGLQAKLLCLQGLELDPEQLTVEQSPRGGGEKGDMTGRQTPKLSTKNGRFEPCESCPRGSDRGQQGGPGQQGLPERGGAIGAFYTKFSILSFHMRFCLKRELHH